MRVGMLADPAMHWSQSWMTYHHPHAMTRIKSIIKCIISKPGYNGNTQLESRGLPGPSFEQRQELGWYGRWERPGCRDRWWIIICARGTKPAKIAMCPPVTWSDQSRMFAATFPFNLSLIFTASERGFCFCPDHLIIPGVTSPGVV